MSHKLKTILALNHELEIDPHLFNTPTCHAHTL
jgi:hypothetical protein